MYDSSQFLLPGGVVQRYFTHQGVIGKGRDFLTGAPCTIHLYIDPISKRKLAMQLYQNISQEFLNSKVEALVRSVSAEYVPNYSRVAFLSSRNTHTGTELSVMYDVGQFYGMSLENLLTIRLKNGQLFKEAEVMEFLSQILDSVYYGGSKHGEYLELTPINIFCKMESKHGYRYFPNNFGLSFVGSKWERKYHDPTAKLHSGKTEAAVRQAIFIVGMVALQMCTLQQPKNFYSPDGTSIDEKLLAKALEAIKLNFSADMFGLISRMCLIGEDKRISLKEIYAQDGYLLRYRKVKYFQGKLGSFKRMAGFVLSNEEIEGFAETTNEKMELYRGTYSNGKYQGYGVLEKDKETMYLGEFVKGDFRYGQCIIRNKCIVMGSFENGNPMKVVQLTLNIHHLTAHQPSLYFVGKMNCKFQREEGKLVEKDGSTYEGEFVNDKKSGKGTYRNPTNRTLIEGAWLNDKADGKAYYTIQGKRYEATFRQGNLESKKELS